MWLDVKGSKETSLPATTVCRLNGIFLTLRMSSFCADATRALDGLQVLFQARRSSPSHH